MRFVILFCLFFSIFVQANKEVMFFNAETEEQMSAFVKANPNARGPFGRTPLHYAINKKAVDTLIKAGANVHAQDQYGQTP